MDRDRVREELEARITDLRTARDAAGDDAAKAALLTEIRRLQQLVVDVDLKSADQLALDVDAAVDALEQVRTAHALDAVSALERTIDRLGDLEAELKSEERLPRAVAAATSTPVLATVAAAATVAVAAVVAAKTFQTLRAKRFDALKAEYADLFAQCRATPAKLAEIEQMAKRIRASRVRYEGVGGPLGVPWQFIGVMHAMESSLSFNRHLHNGDPLTARTKKVPAGHPKAGSPPFTWEESAVDAIKLKKLDRVTDWSTPHMLFLLESFNGFGYRQFSLPTPYLWSFSNIYSKGKFVDDGVFDADAVSKQCGAALLLQAVGE